RPGTVSVFAVSQHATCFQPHCLIACAGTRTNGGALPKILKKRPMPDSRRQISHPRELGQASFAGGVADKGEAWMRICLRLRAGLGEEVFSSWFRCLELDGLSDGDASLSVPTKFLQSWIRSHYADRILPTLAAEFPAVKRISINVRSSARPAVARVAGGIRHLSSCSIVDPAKGRTSTPLPPPSPVAMPGNTLVASKRTSMSQSSEEDALSGSPLDRRLTFANFLVGPSNQLAHAAAQQIARASAGDPLHFNPLYLHASVGLGKTHLLQAIVHASASDRRRVIYLTAERFMYGFVSALKAQTAIAFKERLRGIDVFVIA